MDLITGIAKREAAKIAGDKDLCTPFLQKLIESNPIEVLRVGYENHILPSESVDELMFAIANDVSKLEAIKIYKSMFGCGLRESKEAVDKIVEDKEIKQKEEG